MKDLKKILILSLGGAGDTLMATPLLRELHAAFPNAAVDVLTMQGAVARDILRGNSNVSEILHHDFMHSSSWASLAFCCSLRKRRYDVSFTVMPQNRLEYNFITGLVGAKERIGFRFLKPCGAMGRLFLTRQVSEREEHLVENNLRLFSEGLGLPLSGKVVGLELFVPEESFQTLEKWAETFPMLGKRLIGMHPGSGTTKNLELRRWAPEKWAELCRLIGQDENTVILLFGSPEEQSLREQIIHDADLPVGRIVGLKPTPILDTAAFISKLDQFVCCDTLLTHIAAALKVPQVVIMGPTPHESVCPYAAPHRIVRLGLPCSPCYGYSKFGINCTNKIRMQCLKEITPETVFAALQPGGWVEELLPKKTPHGVSVVIPSFNNEATLVATLDSIVKQAFDGAREILLVDDRSTDRTRSLAEAYVFPEGWSLRCVENERSGLAGGYNCGWRAARYDTVVFMHADCFLLRTDAMARTLDFFRKPDVVAVMSRTVFPEDEWVSMGFWDQVARGRYVGKESYAMGGKFDAIRRETLEAVGGFDQHRFFCAGEDSDMFLRLKRSGRIARSDVRVVHAHHFSLEAPLYSIFQKQSILGQGFGALFRKHGLSVTFYREMRSILALHLAKLFLIVGLAVPYVRWVCVAILLAVGFLFSGRALRLKDRRVLWVPGVNVIQLFVFTGGFLRGFIFGRQSVRRGR